MIAPATMRHDLACLVRYGKCPVAGYVPGMDMIIEALLPLGMGAVLVVLGLGLYTLVRGQSKTQLNSNQLMRLRVVLQAIAVVLLLAWFSAKTGGA